MEKKDKIIKVKSCKSCPLIILDINLDESLCAIGGDKLISNKNIDKKPSWCMLNKKNIILIAI